MPVFGEINERIIGFCGWAWDDVYKDVQTLRFHGTSSGSPRRAPP